MTTRDRPARPRPRARVTLVVGLSRLVEPPAVVARRAVLLPVVMLLGRLQVARRRVRAVRGRRPACPFEALLIPAVAAGAGRGGDPPRAGRARGSCPALLAFAFLLDRILALELRLHLGRRRADRRPTGRASWSRSLRRGASSPSPASRRWCPGGLAEPGGAATAPRRPEGWLVVLAVDDALVALLLGYRVAALRYGTRATRCWSALTYAIVIAVAAGGDPGDGDLPRLVGPGAADARVLPVGRAPRLRARRAVASPGSCGRRSCSPSSASSSSPGTCGSAPDAASRPRSTGLRRLTDRPRGARNTCPRPPPSRARMPSDARAPGASRRAPKGRPLVTFPEIDAAAQTPASQTRLKRQLAEQAIAQATAAHWAEAAETNRRLLELGPDSEAENRLAKALWEQGELGCGARALPEGPRARPDQPDRRAQHRPPQGAARRGRREDRRGQARAPRPRSASSSRRPARPASPTSPTSPAPRELAQVNPGDAVELIPEGNRLIAISNGIRIGVVEPRVAARLLKLMADGNKYLAGVTSLGDRDVRLIIREVFQDPRNYGKVSFPTAAKSTDLRPYTKGTLVREDEELEDDLEDDIEDEEIENLDRVLPPEETTDEAFVEETDELEEP